MEIDRKIISTENLAAMLSFKHACLNCKDCNGICWQFFEMSCLPETVLNHVGRTA